MDLFVFQDDTLGRIDAYQRVENPDGQGVQAASRSGRKQLVVVGNLSGEQYLWNEISACGALRRKTVSLTGEDPSAPVMAAACRMTAGETRTVPLEPVLSEIRLHSLRCDFRGKPYEGERLTDVRVYLVNVCREAALLEEAEAPSSWLLSGGLREGDLALVDHPEMLSATLSGDIGEEPCYPDFALYAYPNAVEDESLGRPHTRLVVEGTLQGVRCYYPVDIAPLERNRCYTLDITLTLPGTDDPDTPAVAGAVEAGLHVAPWYEKEPKTLTF